MKGTSWRQVVLYGTTAATIIYTAYDHLDFAAKGIRNLSPSVVLAAWPALFLIAGTLFLLLSLGISVANQEAAARMALIGAIIALGYYLFIIPAGFCLMSILLFILPKGILTIVIPCLLLIFTIWYSSRTGHVFLWRRRRQSTETK